MRFTVARLCGGKALMATPREPLEIDLDRAGEILADESSVRQKEDMILVLEWNGMETTLYPQGKIMFYPLEDRDLCIRYASDILNRISG
ncbi:MAG: hypothetical protein RBQ77_03525 [Candidatus Methanomethylophilaceae archaeon]|nr:hypothetical protein [Candidatus Methanomethylophilaceae archaeon]NLF33626.1 hypothetical protein [Thermoplasmatales archaeon]